MKVKACGLLASIVMAAAASGCQTVSDQAPIELKEAEKSVDAARAADVEDYMPSAMEAADRKLAHAVDLLDDSASYSKDGVKSQAQGTQSEAIKAANEAKAIADGSVKLVSDMRAYDSNSGAYLSVAEKGARADALQAQLNTLKGRNTELERKLAGATAEANRPREEAIPADFRVGKPVAYFATGSTVVAAKYRNDIEELASLIKNNGALQVRLEGFADPRGSAEKNRRLAERRLEAVAEQLRAQGVPANKMQLVTVGATADASTARGTRAGELQLDRKVTATITSTTAH